MFSLFKSRITSEQAAMALTEITRDIRANYVQKVFSRAPLPCVEIVQGELFFLAMYIIDGLIKNSNEESWMANQEIIAKRYYSKCAELAGEEIDTFMWLFFDKMNFYNQGLSQRASEIINLQSHDDRLVAVGAIVGELFAELCDFPEDNLHKLIGAGAFVAVNSSTEKLFTKSRIAT